MIDQLLAEHLNLHRRETRSDEDTDCQAHCPFEAANTGVVLRSYASMRHVKPEVYNVNMRRPCLTPTAFGRMSKGYLSGATRTRQIASGLGSGQRRSSLLSRKQDPRKITRKSRFVELEGANHFVSVQRFAYA